MDDIIDRYKQPQETHEEAVERATAYEAVLADQRDRVRSVIYAIASREPACPYPKSLADACVSELILKGLL